MISREDIIRIAREQGLPETDMEGVFIVNADDLGRFAAAESEACAQIADISEPYQSADKIRERKKMYD
jgi:hypothetical protein